MKSYAKYLSVLGILSIIGCGSDSSSPTGPDDKGNESPFKGKWTYITYKEFTNGGADTLDLTEEFKLQSVVYYDSTGRYNLPSRPKSALDSIKYFFHTDSIFETTYTDNFLNYKGRAYVFKGSKKDTLDFSNTNHIEVLIRSN